MFMVFLLANNFCGPVFRTYMRTHTANTPRVLHATGQWAGAGPIITLFFLTKVPSSHTSGHQMNLLQT